MWSTFSNSDVIGKIDSDTFLVFIGNYKTVEFVESKATDLCNNLCKTYENDDNSITISASIGIAFYPEHGQDYNSIYEKATAALQQVKEDSSGGFHIY